jgi:hypothetical protein
MDTSPGNPAKTGQNYVGIGLKLIDEFGPTPIDQIGPTRLELYVADLTKGRQSGRHDQSARRPARGLRCPPRRPRRLVTAPVTPASRPFGSEVSGVAHIEVGRQLLRRDVDLEMARQQLGRARVTSGAYDAGFHIWAPAQRPGAVHKGVDDLDADRCHHGSRPDDESTSRTFGILRPVPCRSAAPAADATRPCATSVRRV